MDFVAIQKIQIKELANKLYDKFEREGFTLEQAARYLQTKYAAAWSLSQNFRMARNDISAHVSSPESKLRLNEKFDRKKHTHNFANL